MIKKRHIIYSGQVIKLSINTVELPGGELVEHEAIMHPGGAVVAAIDADQQICLLRQYRSIVDDWVWECPAGKLDPGESPVSTAQRELQEEAGVQADEWRHLGKILSSPGVFDEVIHLFLATGLQHMDVQHDQHEHIEVHWLDLQTAYQWVMQNQIIDAKTVAIIVKTAALLGVPRHD